MNFHPYKQLYQVAGAGDWTTDPWITKPALYHYTIGDPLSKEDRNSRLLHIAYWAFHCTDSFSMDWITIKFIGCGFTVFAVQICLYFCHFWSNSDFSKAPITPHVSCHVLVMSWEHNDSIFDASLVAKWLHIWNVCSAICSTKMSVSWWVLVRFWLFKDPYSLTQRSCP